MRRLCLFVLLLLLPDAAMARCAPFNFFDSVNKIPYVVHGRVIQSNKESLLAAQCSPELCRHRFSVDVVEVIKGKTAETKLQFQYDYVGQRPEIAVFAEGEEYVFAVSNIRGAGRPHFSEPPAADPGSKSNTFDKIKRALKK